MDEHLRVGSKYRSVQAAHQLLVRFDDQEFVVAFETDSPSDFLDLVQELRERKQAASLSVILHVHCRQRTLGDCLDGWADVRFDRSLGQIRQCFSLSKRAILLARERVWLWFVIPLFSALTALQLHHQGRLWWLSAEWHRLGLVARGTYTHNSRAS